MGAAFLICLGALAAGALVAIWAPVFQFAVALIGLTLVGASVAWARGTPAGEVWTWAAAVYVSTQVGYACGLAVVARVQARRQRINPRKAQVRPMREPSLK